MYKSYSERLDDAVGMLLGCSVLFVMAIATLIGKEECTDRFLDSVKKIRDKDKCQ